MSNCFNLVYQFFDDRFKEGPGLSNLYPRWFISSLSIRVKYIRQGLLSVSFINDEVDYTHIWNYGFNLVTILLFDVNNHFP